MTRPALILISSGDRVYREYMVRSIAARYDVLLLATEPPTWERDLIRDHRPISPDDEEGLLARVAELAGEYRVSGVLTYHEPCVGLAARAAAMLGVPGPPVPAIEACRDKHLGRVRMQAAGVPVPASYPVETRDEARSRAREIGYPVVVKPRALSAGFGVRRAADETQLDDAFDGATASTLPEAWAHTRGVLVEEYVDGPEISVDSVVDRRGVHPVLFTRKVSGFAPAFEEVGHICAAAEHVVDDPERIREVVTAAHEALGLSDVCTHTEIRLGPHGPRVIEVNGRTGGDLIPYLGELATGIDVSAASADVCVGALPELTPDRDLVAGIRFCYPDGSGRLAGFGLPRGAARPPWLHRVERIAEAGTAMDLDPARLYFARAGLAVVLARTVEECRERMEWVASGIVVGLDQPA